MVSARNLWMAYRLRWKRRRFLMRAIRKRNQLKLIRDRTQQIQPDDILSFSCVRNEIERLPYFLNYYRSLGIRHFLVVDNGSDDGTVEYLCAQSDVSVWSTARRYKLSRFGMDWLGWLHLKYGHGHWCLTVDADEILVYSNCDTQGLGHLTRKLDDADIVSFGALLLDMYPKGPLKAQAYSAGDDPFETLCWFDNDNYTRTFQPNIQNFWIQGGVRARCFFSNEPARAPTLNKTPLVKWNRRYTYISSTHSMLPRRLNRVFDQTEEPRATGVLLHSKFLHSVVERSRIEKHRREHFENSNLYDEYYDRLSDNPDLWCDWSIKYTGWRQLLKLGLITR